MPVATVENGTYVCIGTNVVPTGCQIGVKQTKIVEFSICLKQDSTSFVSTVFKVLSQLCKALKQPRRGVVTFRRPK